MTPNKMLSRAAFAGATFLAAASAHAGGNVFWSIGINAPLDPYGASIGTTISNGPGYHHPAPAYVESAPIYYAPAPVYYAPPVFVRPRPIYYHAPAPVYAQPRHHHPHWWKHRGDDGWRPRHGHGGHSGHGGHDWRDHRGGDRGWYDHRGRRGRDD